MMSCILCNATTNRNGLCSNCENLKINIAMEINPKFNNMKLMILIRIRKIAKVIDITKLNDFNNPEIIEIISSFHYISSNYMSVIYNHDINFGEMAKHILRLEEILGSEK